MQQTQCPSFKYLENSLKVKCAHVKQITQVEARRVGAPQHGCALVQSANARFYGILGRCIIHEVDLVEQNLTTHAHAPSKIKAKDNINNFASKMANEV